VSNQFDEAEGEGNPGGNNSPQTAVQQEHARMTRDFLERAQALGYGNLKNYYWYHTIDLGNGLVTPGVYDYRSNLEAFRFPENLKGKTVLDVGAATGFFSFELEKRGARVVSTELPSMLQVDKFPGETSEQTMKKLQAMMPAHSTYSHEQCLELFAREQLNEFYHWFLLAPFDFCHEILKSQVRRCFSTIYDLSPEVIGEESFDLVYIGDVLLHTVYPLKALAAAASLCRGTLVLSQALPQLEIEAPLMLYVGGSQPGSDDISWWWPNWACFRDVLQKLGFSRVELLGHHEGIVRPGGGSYSRAVIQAIR
jgi:tRNA (mo5U34)-methyltransferase